MKAFNTIAASLLLLTFYSLSAQEYYQELESTVYNISLFRINVGTGHGTGYTANIGVQKGRKSLVLGCIYSENNKKLAGLDIKFKVFLGNEHAIYDSRKAFRPYLQYNLTLQNGMSDGSERVELNGKVYELPAEPGMISTIGHFIGYGNKLMLVGKFYLDCSLGLGFYTGSLDKINGPNTWGIHWYNNGLTYSFKIGAGFTFK